MDSRERRQARWDPHRKADGVQRQRQILQAHQERFVIFLKIKDSRRRTWAELKRAVDKLKKTVVANNGDIAGVESDWLNSHPGVRGVERA